MSIPSLKEIVIDNEYLSRFKTQLPEASEPRSFRDHALKTFTDKLNIGRFEKGFKPLIPGQVLRRVSDSVYPEKATGHNIWRLFKYFEEWSTRSNIPFGALFWSQTDPNYQKKDAE